MILSEEEIRERIEHRDVLLDIRAILATSSGKRFFKYMFRQLEVGKLPPLGSEGNWLMDKLGYLRSGQAVFELVAEADAEVAGALLAENEKERYAQIYADSQIGS